MEDYCFYFGRFSSCPLGNQLSCLGSWGTQLGLAGFTLFTVTGELMLD